MVVTTCHTPDQGSTMTKKREKPAVVVTQTFGGIHATARALALEAGEEVHFTTISKWLNRTGNVPYQWHRTVIEASQRPKWLVEDGRGKYYVYNNLGQITKESMKESKAQAIVDAPPLGVEDLMYWEG